MNHIDFSKAIRYIGCDDHSIDLFENQYKVPKGISYNSYLILDEKVAIMDTVDRRASQDWLEKLRQGLDGRKPDYLVVHHLEPDHAYHIQLAAELYPEMTIVASAKAVAMMPQFFTMDFTGRVMAVQEGDKLSLGQHELTFVMAPMVHWPEVMVSYESSEKVLFSADGFGKFGALDIDDNWDDEARRYYFNIVGKYGGPVQTLLKKAAGLDIRTICPLHGPVLTGDLSHYIGKYQTWSSYQPEEDGVVIAYASIHGNTEKAAHKLAEILRQKGAEQVRLFDLSRSDKSEVVENAFRYSKLVLAASSYDGGVFPPMEHLLTTLVSKMYQNRRVALVENGSWGPTAGRVMKSYVDKLKKIDLCPTMVTIWSTLKDKDLSALEQLAEELLA
ncbi:MAG: FprA family A-type flavoprotein [Oscillospiraceae bacterium]|nr:FprA family A-type flavoprotein [Oscillospiraceae bacterium]